MSYQNSVTGKITGLKLAVKAITNRGKYHREDEFMKRLAEELFLEEVLAGEANPEEFLRESFDRVIHNMEVSKQELKLKTLKERL